VPAVITIPIAYAVIQIPIEGAGIQAIVPITAFFFQRKSYIALSDL